MTSCMYWFDSNGLKGYFVRNKNGSYQLQEVYSSTVPQNSVNEYGAYLSSNAPICMLGEEVIDLTRCYRSQDNVSVYERELVNEGIINEGIIEPN